MKAFILAGGFATRLWPLTEKRAKPLLPLAGKPILTHIVENIPEGIPITVSTNAVFQEGFEKWKGTLDRSVEIIIEDAHKDDHKLGALGATAKWIKEAKLQEDLLLLTGDNYIGFQISDFLNAYRSDIPLLAAHDIKDTERATQFGTVTLNEDKTIKEFEEKPKEPKTTLVSTGCSVLPASILPIIVNFAAEHPDNVGGIFEELLRRGLTIDCYTFSQPWFDIGSFDTYLEATRTLVGKQTLTEEGTSLTETHTEGSIVLGARSQVSQSTLRDVVLFEDCTVEDCILENCILDNNCTLKGIDLAGKMLREGTKLM